MDTLLSLKVFCQVVQSGSFTKAAELLDISIPMASKHVAALEKIWARSCFTATTAA